MSLTTLQKLAAALEAPCSKHGIPAGHRCPEGLDGACLARRTAALAAVGGQADDGRELP